MEFIQLLNMVVDRPVVDRTGLSGRFAIHLEYAEPNVASGDSADRPSIYAALQDQLGLKLEPARGPNEFLVIDHIEKPGEN